MRLSDAESALARLEARVDRFHVRNVWRTRATALRAMLERSRKHAAASTRSGQSDSTTTESMRAATSTTTASLQRQDAMVDRALQQMEEARGHARETADALARNRETMERAVDKTHLIRDSMDDAHSSLRSMRARATRVGVLTCVLVVFLAAAIGTVAYIVSK